MDTKLLMKNDGTTIKEGTQVEVMKELFKIYKETGNGLIDIKYNSQFRATEFIFEGYYCNFSLLLS